MLVDCKELVKEDGIFWVVKWGYEFLLYFWLLIIFIEIIGIFCLCCELGIVFFDVWCIFFIGVNIFWVIFVVLILSLLEMDRF